MKVHGNKTYFVSIAMAVIGALILAFPPKSTWSDPSASVSTVIGVLMIAFAAGFAAIRHAVYQAVDILYAKLHSIHRELNKAIPNDEQA